MLIFSTVIITIILCFLFAIIYYINKGYTLSYNKSVTNIDITSTISSLREVLLFDVSKRVIYDKFNIKLDPSIKVIFKCQQLSESSNIIVACFLDDGKLHDIYHMPKNNELFRITFRRIDKVKELISYIRVLKKKTDLLK